MEMMDLVNSEYPFPLYTKYEAKARWVLELPVEDDKRIDPFYALAPIGAKEACLIRMTAIRIVKIEEDYLRDEPMEVLYQKWCSSHWGDLTLPKLFLPTPNLQGRLAETLMDREQFPYVPAQRLPGMLHEKYEAMRGNIEALKSEDWGSSEEEMDSCTGRSVTTQPTQQPPAAGTYEDMREASRVEMFESIYHPKVQVEFTEHFILRKPVRRESKLIRLKGAKLTTPECWEDEIKQNQIDKEAERLTKETNIAKDKDISANYKQLHQRAMEETKHKMETNNRTKEDIATMLKQFEKRGKQLIARFTKQAKAKINSTYPTSTKEETIDEDIELSDTNVVDPYSALWGKTTV